MNKLIKPLDLLLVAVLLIGGAGFWYYSYKSTDNATAVIYIDGEIYERIDLSKVSQSYEIELPCSPEATLLVESHAVSFHKAACPDKLCIGCGKLTKRGDTAACLPAKTVVVIENGKDSEIDALVY